MTDMQMDMRKAAHPAARTGLFKPAILALAVLGVAFPAGMPQSRAAELDISNIPLVVGGSQEPNLMILIDNSAPMHWPHNPANAERYVSSNGNPGDSNIFYRSAHINKVYYDPMVKYRPPYEANGVSRANVSFTAAPRDGYGIETPGPGTTSDLGTSFRDTWYSSLEHWTGTAAQPAYYFRYDEKLSGCQHIVTAANKGTASANRNQVIGMDFYHMGMSGVSDTTMYEMNANQFAAYQKCFQKVRVGATVGGNPNGSTTSANSTAKYVADLDGYNHPDNRGSAAKKQQNFANWYSYYRIRINQIKSVMSYVMYNVNPNIRVGFGLTGAYLASAPSYSSAAQRLVTNTADYVATTNYAYQDTSVRDGSYQSIYSIARGVRPFKDFPNNNEVEPSYYKNQKYKSEFYRWLFSIQTRQGGDLYAGRLRRAVDAAGRYYATSNGKGGAWAVHPGVKDSPIRACRRSYTLLASGGINERETQDISPISTLANPNPPIYDVDGNYGPEIKNIDGNGTPYVYVPKLPFWDSDTPGHRVPGTMADIALYYWYQSLLPKEPNKVPPSGVDFATWPHMNLLVLGMGNPTDVNEEAVLRNAYLGTPLPNKWGYNETNSWWQGEDNTSSGRTSTTYRENIPRSYLWPNDLLHAAINSRGAYYDTTNPEELVNTLNQALDAIRTDKVITARMAVNSGSVKNPPLTYQAMFNSDWQTNLRASRMCTGNEVFQDANDKNGNKKSSYRQERSCNAEGDLWATESWNALDKLKNRIGNGNGTNRSIKTWNGTVGKDFNWVELSAAQQKSIGKNTDNDTTRQKIVQYIRGNGSNEGENAGQFRVREGKVLGDIVNAALLYVGNDDFGYANAGGLTADERKAYRKRKQDNANRQEVLYAAANDGMLHAFNADDCDPLNTGGSCQGGEELFAYVPSSIIPRLDKLTSTSYKHEFYVDGSPAVNDAFLDGAWKTVLVGSTGAGGRSYFALDIENPAAFNETSVLWERTGGYKNSDDASDPKNIAPDAGFEELGVAIGQATVANLGGIWAAVFGNGYNSPGHTARLFVVNLATGALIAEIDTKVGDAANPNGLSTPIVVDENRDGIADVVYAGDLWGNLWKFNLKLHSDPSTLLPVKLLEAKDLPGATQKAQPITAKPEVTRHNKGGLMVYVGTGKFFETTDKKDKQVQTFYGVRDYCGAACEDNVKVSRDDLMQQSIKQETRANFCTKGTGATVSQGCSVETVRTITNCGNPEGADSECAGRSGDVEKGFYLDLAVGGKKLGERVTAVPIVWSDRVIFNTIEPSDDECDPLGDGWIYELEPFTGGRTDFSVYDLSNTGEFKSTLRGEVVSAKKIGMGGGIVARGTNKYLGNTKGNVQKIANNPKHVSMYGRKSWRQVR